MLHSPHFSCYTPPFVPVTKSMRTPVTRKTPQIGPSNRLRKPGGAVRRIAVNRDPFREIRFGKFSQRHVPLPGLAHPAVLRQKLVHPVNGEVPPVKGRPRKLPHYANRGKTSSSGGELASARSCFSTVRTALGKLRIAGLLAQFDVARSFPQFPRPLLLQPTILTSERGTRFGIRKPPNHVPPPHLPDDPKNSMSRLSIASLIALISCFTVNPSSTFPGSAAAQSCNTRSDRKTVSSSAPMAITSTRRPLARIASQSCPCAAPHECNSTAVAWPGST